MKRYRLLFGLVFIVVLLWGGFEWRRNIFTYHWSETQRKEYLAATIKETVFHKEQFVNVLAELAKIREAHEQGLKNNRELFIKRKEDNRR